ncbi:hypothetical protein EV426DRAFT_719599 [Tirmania nivea]|nr:hypothetical protein EV426DRAFT_719599 [Tirmania nivea]
MITKDTENRLGFKFQRFEINKAVDLDFIRSVAESESEGVGQKVFKEIKEMVYNRILEFLDTEALLCIFLSERGYAGRDIIIEREREISSEHAEVSGNLDFVLIDLITPAGSKDDYVSNYVLVVECERSSYAAAKRRRMLSMKDMRESNGGGDYDFVTTGEDWQLIHYNGVFTQSEKFMAVFRIGRRCG